MHAANATLLPLPIVRMHSHGKSGLERFATSQDIA
jgi:hypothetical protein